MVDGDNEDKKIENSEKLGLDQEEEDVDIIEGEVCCPYYDFISVSDRWLPTKDSLENALGGKFDPCGVLFAHSGTFIVPWTKERFKKEFRKFLDKMPKDDIQILFSKGTKDLIIDAKKGE